MREDYHAEQGLPFFENLLQDLRFALRMLAKSPGFSAIAILTMALGIGATTAIFSLVDATLLHPLPYPHPEELVRIEDDLPGAGATDAGISIPEFKDLQRSGIFQYVVLQIFGSANLTGVSQPSRMQYEGVSPAYFAMLGVKPELGQTFDPQDQTPGFTLDVVISDGLWKRAFGSDPHIVGRSLRGDNDLYRVIGVMPPGFRDPGRTVGERNTEQWAALGFEEDPAPAPNRSLRLPLETVGRLKPGLTVAAAQSQLDALVASLRKQFPDDYPADSKWTVRLVPLKENVVGNVRQSLILLLGAVALVLLIGCVNVANLLLARASARSREMAVRQALGAARKRLVRQLLTESLLLSLLGGVAGLVILFCMKGFLLRLIPESLPRLNDLSINWTVMLFALAASIAAGVIFGLAPARQAGRLNLASTLRVEGRGSKGSTEQTRTRRVLVVTEFALSLVLMVAAGLLLRSFWDLYKAPLGFNPQHVMSVQLWLPSPNDPKTDIYGTAAQEAVFARELLRRSRLLPGVQEAALGSEPSIPLHHDRNRERADRGRTPDTEQAAAFGGAVASYAGIFSFAGDSAAAGPSVQRRRRRECAAGRRDQPGDGGDLLAGRGSAWEAAEGWPWEGWGWPTCEQDLDHDRGGDRGCSNRVAGERERSANLSEPVPGDAQGVGHLSAWRPECECDPGRGAGDGAVRESGAAGLRGADAGRCGVGVAGAETILDGYCGGLRDNGAAAGGAGNLRGDLVSS